MSAGSLRRQAQPAILTIYRIAGKDYTTLNDIEGMKTACRVPAKAQGSALFKGQRPHHGSGTSGTASAPSAQAALESDRATAERKLAAYITRKHDPKASRSSGDPNAIKIADALSVYMVEKIAHSARPKAGIAMVENLGDFFGERTIGELNGRLQRDFAQPAWITECSTA